MVEPVLESNLKAAKKGNLVDEVKNRMRMFHHCWRHQGHVGGEDWKRVGVILRPRWPGRGDHTWLGTVKATNSREGGGGRSSSSEPFFGVEDGMPRWNLEPVGQD